MTRVTSRILAFAAALLAGSTAANALPNVNAATFDANTAPAVSNSDLINGVTGIIKESSVVLISANRTVKELPLKKSGYYR